MRGQNYRTESPCCSISYIMFTIQNWLLNVAVLYISFPASFLVATLPKLISIQTIEYYTKNRVLLFFFPFCGRPCRNQPRTNSGLVLPFFVHVALHAAMPTLIHNTELVEQGSTDGLLQHQIGVDFSIIL